MGRLTALPARLGALPPRIAPEPKRADKFYLSPEWRRLRQLRSLDPDYYQARARASRDGSNGRVILDHHREIKDGGAELDPANTVWLTHVEHQAKTARRRAERARGEVKSSQSPRP